MPTKKVAKKAVKKVAKKVVKKVAKKATAKKPVAKKKTAKKGKTAKKRSPLSKGHNIRQIMLRFNGVKGECDTVYLNDLDNVPFKVIQDNILLFATHLGVLAWIKSPPFRSGFERLTKDEKELTKIMFNNGQKKVYEMIDKYKKKGKK